MNKVRTICLLSVVLALSVSNPISQAASVGANGYTNGFGALPPATDWSSGSAGSGAGAYASAGDIDGAVAAVNASSVGAAVISIAQDPPDINASATWSSTGLYLQERCTSVGA